MTYEIITGDVLEVLRGLESDRFHASFFDPPYGFGTKEPTLKELLAYLQGAELDTGGDFMGADWSVPSVAVWTELRRVLKPGAYVNAFAGSKTQDLISLGMRAAGFRVQDTMMWMHAEGAPKPFSTTDKLVDEHLGIDRKVHREPTTEAAKTWKDHAHALAPSFEPVIIAKKPSPLGLPETVLEYGTGALNVGECRRSVGERPLREHVGTAGAKYSTGLGRSQATKAAGGTTLGRWPKNVALMHASGCMPVGKKKVRTGVAVRHRSNGNILMSDRPNAPKPDMTYAGEGGLEEVERWACVDGCPVAILDAQSGERPSTLTGRADPSKAHDNRGDNAGASTFGGGNGKVYADAGAASRFYWQGSISASEAQDRASTAAALSSRATTGAGSVPSGAPPQPPPESEANGAPSRRSARTAKRSSSATIALESGSAPSSAEVVPIDSSDRGASGAGSPCETSATSTAPGPVRASASLGSGCLGVCTPGTVSRSPLGSVTCTEPTRPTGNASSPESPPTRRIPSPGDVSSVAHAEPTDTTTTTTSPMRSDGSATYATSDTTPPSEADGESARSAPCRFMFCAKPAEAERDLGLDESFRREGDKYRNSHRNVKPIPMTEYQARLLRPAVPDATLIVLYCGSGSEIIGALRAGWSHVIGIERDPHWVRVAKARIERWEEARRNRPDFSVAEVLASDERAHEKQVAMLFGGSK